MNSLQLYNKEAHSRRKEAVPAPVRQLAMSLQSLCHAEERREVESGACQLRQLVVGFEAAQEAAELVVVVVVGQALLAGQDVPRSDHQVVQEPRALRLAGEQRPPHRRQPHLRQALGVIITLKQSL